MTDNPMTTWKREQQRQTMIYKTIHRTLEHEQHEPH
jgi:hypothetical protein